MIESTARAERIDLQPSTSPGYLWHVPQKPISVRIPFTLVDRLEHEAVESFRSLTSRGSEIGGLLLGVVAQGVPTVVSLEDYEPVLCDYTRGPLYRLSDADMGRFERALEQRTTAGGLQVVGFFRSHTRKGLSLDPEDVAFFEARFRDPNNVALVIRPFATKASIAGIFIWENGKMRGESSYLEFPFRSSQLRDGRTGPESAPSGEIDGPASAPVPAAPKPSVRAQIVPIASRRDISLPGSISVSPAAEPPAPVAAPAPLPEPVRAAAPQAPPTAASVLLEAPKAAPVEQKPPVAEKSVVERVVERPAPPRVAERVVAHKLSERVVEKPAEKAVESSASVSTPEPERPAVFVKPPAFGVKPEPEVESEPEPEEPPRRGGKLILIAVLSVAALATFFTGFVYPGFLHRGTSTAAVPAQHQDSSALALRVEHSGGDLLLTWNRDADVVKSATRAVLSITDGDQHQNVQMDLSQLRNGSIMYTPLTPDVSFKMEVTGQDQTKVTSESLRSLRNPRPSPMADESQPGQPTPAGAVQAPKTEPNAAAAKGTPAASVNSSAAEAAPEAVVETRPAVPVKQFNTESLSQRLRPTRSSDLPEAPTVARGDSASASVPGVSLNAIAPPPMGAPTAPPAPAKATPAKTQVTSKTGGQIHQAELVYRKEPEYPKIARQAGARGTVELLASIGADGNVKSVKVLKGHPMLVKAASEAVMQWKYKPTLLNGQPVDSQTQITLNFLGER
jgi:protein TonB